MARLETQINQIYLTHPDHKKNSLILYEEQLTNSLQLFIVAELWNMQKRSENTDLKKISEIILQSFRGNNKLPAETLFETSLSQINQNLADLAHDGRKSWVGKFSCMICVRGADNNIYLANNGQTSAWLKRRSELLEVLPAEKRGNHPLKTFINFTQGKLTDNDSLILTTANIFNYISFELFSKLLDQNPLQQACNEISKILKDSKSEDQAFSAFLMHFTKKPTEEISPVSTQEVYAPLPEEMEMDVPGPSRFRIPLPTLPSFRLRLPTINFNFNGQWLKKIQLPQYFKNLSRAGKFFFISFAVFLVLFLINLGIYAGRLNGKKTQSRVAELKTQIDEDIAQTQSALIYKDENQALAQLNQTIADLASLAKLDQTTADELTPKVEQIKTVVNKINTVHDPGVYLDLKRHPTFLAASIVGLLFGNQDSNSLSRYSETLNDYFLLNSLKNPITAIAYFSTAGVIVSSGNQIFRIDPDLKQFEPLISLDGDIKQMKVANNSIYALTDNQLVKVTYKNKYQAQVSLDGLGNVRDFGVDKDIYILSADKVIKYVSGAGQAFPMPKMTENLSNGDKIFVGANLYILEANKKRVLIVNKNGALINQIYFPTTANITDFSVDEGPRNIFLLDDNKLYKITF